ncbi:MAG: hypothetical protein IT306_27400 [Chloroflexi bacterium]|nr:hypothetical protein [Chloroflexota bacterium]
MHQLHAHGWRRLAAVGLGGGLLLTGGWYAYAHTAAPDLTRGVLAQEVAVTLTAVPTPEPPTATTQTLPLTVSPAASPVPGQPARPATRPAATPAANPNSRRPAGEVTAISQEPASFTIRTAAGETQTYRVLQTTVFAAGRDRPYRFDLLKVGDTVSVATGGQGKKQGPQTAEPSGRTPGQGQPASPKPRAGQGQGAVANPRAAIRAAQASGETAARTVMVHPAGEPARPGGGKKSGGQSGSGQRNRPAPVASPTPGLGANGQPTTSQPITSQTHGGSHGTGQ